MLTIHQFYARVTHFPVDAHHIAELDKRMSPISGIQYITDQILEPNRFKKPGNIIVLFPFGIYEFEAFLLNESLTLVHTTAKMQVYFHIPVNIIQPFPARVFDVDSLLPRLTP